MPLAGGHFDEADLDLVIPLSGLRNSDLSRSRPNRQLSQAT